MVSKLLYVIAIVLFFYGERSYLSGHAPIFAIGGGCSGGDTDSVCCIHDPCGGENCCSKGEFVSSRRSMTIFTATFRQKAS
jgi:hypothetical protein